MSREEVQFSRRYYESISELPEADQLSVYSSVFEFLFNFKEPNLSGLPKCVFELIRPELQKSNQNFINGKKGGRRVENKPKPKRNLSESQPNANRTLTETQPKPNRKIFIPPLLNEVIAYFEENKYTKDSAEKAFNYYNIANWKDSKGNQVKNWKQKMQGVWFKEENLKNNTNGGKANNSNRRNTNGSISGTEALINGVDYSEFT